MHGPNDVRKMYGRAYDRGVKTASVSEPRLYERPGASGGKRRLKGFDQAIGGGWGEPIAAHRVSRRTHSTPTETTFRQEIDHDRNTCRMTILVRARLWRLSQTLTNLSPPVARAPFAGPVDPGAVRDAAGVETAANALQRRRPIRGCSRIQSRYRAPAPQRLGTRGGTASDTSRFHALQGRSKGCGSMKCSALRARHRANA